MQGSVVRSWLLELAGRAFKANGQDLEHLKGFVADSGEGRWTVQEAIDHDVPAPVITLSLLTRFRSRQDDSYGGQGPRRAPQRVRRPRGQDRVAWHAGAAADGRRPRPAPAEGPGAGRGARADQPIPAPAGAAAQGRAADDEGPAPARGRASAVAGQARGERPARGSPPRARTRPVDRWSCSGRPATSPIARSSRRSTTCGGRTCCRTSSCSWRSAGARTTTRSFRAEIRNVARAVQPGPAARRGRLATFAERICYHQLDFDDAGGFDGLADAPRRPRRRARDARQPAVLPRHPAVAVRGDRRPARPGRARPRAPRRRLAAGRHREAVRPRPRVGQAAQPRGRQGLPRVAGLPHRPLPGQGDGPQPAGLPVRERHLRTALEPALRRPCADHRGRVDRHREPRRLLRGDRRVARRPPEPPAPAGQPGRDGAAGDVRGGRAARREGQGPAGRSRTRPADARRRRGPRPVRARLGGRPRRSPATARKPEVDPSPRPRRSSRPGSRSTTGAGRASRSTSGPASGCPSGRPRSPSSTARSPIACSRTRASSPRRTCSRSGSSRTRGSCCGSGPRSRASVSTSAR